MATIEGDDSSEESRNNSDSHVANTSEDAMEVDGTANDTDVRSDDDGGDENEEAASRSKTDQQEESTERSLYTTGRGSSHQKRLARKMRRMEEYEGTRNESMCSEATGGEGSNVSIVQDATVQEAPGDTLVFPSETALTEVSGANTAFTDLRQDAIERGGGTSSSPDRMSGSASSVGGSTTSLQKTSGISAPPLSAAVDEHGQGIPGAYASPGRAFGSFPAWGRVQERTRSSIRALTPRLPQRDPSSPRIVDSYVVQDNEHASVGDTNLEHGPSTPVHTTDTPSEKPLCRRSTLAVIAIVVVVGIVVAIVVPLTTRSESDTQSTSTTATVSPSASPAPTTIYCSSVCADGSPIDPSFETSIAFTDGDKNLTCSELQDMTSFGNLSPDECDRASYFGVKRCGCPPPAVEVCDICEDGSVPPHLDLDLFYPFSCGTLAFFAFGNNVSEAFCDATKAVGTYCGCDNRLASKSACRICGGSNLDTSATTSRGNERFRCTWLEFGANTQNLDRQCEDVKEVGGESCCIGVSQTTEAPSATVINPSPPPMPSPVPTLMPKVCGDGLLPFRLEVMLNEFPEDISWNISDSSGSVVLKGGPYRKYADIGATIVEDACVVEEECSVFSIYNEAGEGLCCRLVWGGYKLILNGTEIASGGDDFLYSHRIRFGDCAPTSSPTFGPSACDPGEVLFRLELESDGFLNEIDWVLEDDRGERLSQGGPYANDEPKIEEEECIPKDVCATFSIFDSMGNGLSPPGKYTVYLDGVEVSSGGEFGAEQHSRIGNC